MSLKSIASPIMSILLRTALSEIPNPAKKQDAQSLLALLGLKYYWNLTGDIHVDYSKLCDVSGISLHIIKLWSDF